MARRGEPRWYASRGGWYVWRAGKLFLLAKGKEAREEAWEAFHRLALEGKPKDRPISREEIWRGLDLLLEEMKGQLASLTFRFYRRHLEAFREAFKGRDPREISPGDVMAWHEAKGWQRSTRHGSVSSIRRFFRWAVGRGLLERDPLLGLKRPGIEWRREILTTRQVEEILQAVDSPFGDLLRILYLSGMRPSEAYGLQADEVDLARGLIVKHRAKTAARTGRPRVIYLVPEAREILARLVKVHPSGLLLRNRKGGSWTDGKVKDRFTRLRRDLGMGKEATAESFRHLFCTDALERGIPIATVAELMGHASTNMISAHYGHLSLRGESLRRAVEQARSQDPPGSGPHSAPGMGPPCSKT